MSREPLNVVLAVTAVLLLAASGGWLVEHARQPQAAAARAPHGRPPAPATVPAGARLVTLEVSGMTCANCASRVTSALAATAGVRACDVDPPSSRAWVVCDRDVADSALVAAVTRAGTVAGGGPAYDASVVNR